MTPRRRQAAATHHLLARLEPTTVGFKGMGKHPVEVMRLWRLGVRHGKGLSKASRRVLWRMPIVLDSPETVEFLVEVVDSKGDALADRLEEMGLPKDVALYRPTLGARLARVVEHGKTWKARRRAVRWVARIDRRAAVDVLRRVIRAPLLPLRSCALDALREMRPMALAEEDVAWLLDDALEHPLPPGTGQDKGNAPAEYERALLEAVRACPPPEGWRPLEALAGGGGVPMGFLRDGLGADWALGALATAWPDRAAPRIDRALASSMPHRRLGAIEAAALLPEALARPRLLDAATLPNHAAAERAKERWFERFGEACPVSPLAGVPVDLFEGPPSDALLTRLSVLRGASAEAAGKILTAALAEAPSREALVLLLYSLRDVGAAHRHAELEGFSDAHFVVQLTDGLKIWASELLRRFGAPAFDGLFVLAAREAQAGVHDGWLDALASLARKGPFDEAQRGRLRDLAAGLLGHSRRRVVVAACEVLEAVGTPASSVERLWSIVLDPPAPEDADYVRGDTRMTLFALTATVEMPEVDARMVVEADAAFQRGDWKSPRRSRRGRRAARAGRRPRCGRARARQGGARPRRDVDRGLLRGDAHARRAHRQEMDPHGARAPVVPAVHRRGQAGRRPRGPLESRAP